MSDSLSKGEQTRQAILDAASSLFIEQGFHGTSMRQIAGRAGITVGGIYNHFEGKEQIFDEVLLQKHPYRRILAILQAMPATNVEDFARNAANAVIAELGSRPEFLNLAFIELSEFRGRHVPTVFQAIFPKILPLAGRLQGMPGELRELPPGAIVLSFAGVFFAYYLADALTASEEMRMGDRVTLEQCLSIFLHGILKTEQP